MAVAMLVVAVVLVSISYLALKILSEVVVTPPTPVRELADQPRELLRLPGEEVIQLQVSPDGHWLAVITFRQPTGESFLRVYGLEVLKTPGGMDPTPALRYERAIKGYRLGWLNVPVVPTDASLVYEDAGDIFRLDLRSNFNPDDIFPEPVNLTAGSPDLESDPLPSPDGRYILFKRAQLEEGGRLAYWYMRSDGSDPRRVGPLPESPSWSPDATRLATYQEATRSETSRPNEYFLELVELSSGTGDPFAASNGETRYVNWLDDSTLVYVAMYITADLSEVRAVVYRTGTERGADEKGLGTLKSLRDPDAAYSFYLSRDRERLAYLGDKGLEYFDVAEERVYRETLVPYFSTLDWLPEAPGDPGPGIIFARGDIIYNIVIDTTNEVP
jgi:hypothetical protein